MELEFYIPKLGLVPKYIRPVRPVADLIQEYPLDDRADFGVQVEEMLRSMYDIYAPLIILGSSSYTGAEFRVTPGNSFLGRRTPPFDKGNLKLLFPL